MVLTSRPAWNLPLVLAAVALELVGLVVAFTKSVPLGAGLISLGTALTVVVLFRYQDRQQTRRRR